MLIDDAHFLIHFVVPLQGTGLVDVFFTMGDAHRFVVRPRWGQGVEIIGQGGFKRKVYASDPIGVKEDSDGQRPSTSVEISRTLKGYHTDDTQIKCFLCQFSRFI